jgi:NADPH:quinone reductase-like Zn-dependent oxidoreductase
MKAFVQTAYGSPDVLELREIDKPALGDDDVLVRVRAAGVNAGDYFLMSGTPRLLRLARPMDRVIGWDLAGHVEAVGRHVTGFSPGDEVFGECGTDRGGSFAEYVCAPAGRLAPKPATLTFEQAAAVPVAGCTALRGLRDAGKMQPGQKVLINNASGGVGTFAVQIAKALGAEVTGVCSTRNVDLVSSIGADHVIDYTREDFTQGECRYDVILDNIGTHPFSHYRRVLTPHGIVIPNTGHAGMGYIFRAFALSFFSRRQGRMFSGTANSDDLLVLKELIESGGVTPVIDRTYPFDETPAAIGYVGERHARGKVVITV